MATIRVEYLEVYLRKVGGDKGEVEVSMEKKEKKKEKEESDDFLWDELPEKNNDAFSLGNVNILETKEVRVPKGWNVVNLSRATEHFSYAPVSFTLIHLIFGITARSPRSLPFRKAA